MIEGKFKNYTAYLEGGIEGIRRTGLKVLELRERYVKLRMPLAGNVNHVGIMYAGSLFTIGEVTGGAIFLAGFDPAKYFPVVREVNMRFRQPAISDVTLTAELSEATVQAIQAEVDGKGKADFAMDLEIRDAKDTVVAVVHGVWQMRKNPEGFKPPWA